MTEFFLRDYQFAFRVKKLQAKYLFITGCSPLRDRLNVISLPHKVSTQYFSLFM